MAAKKKSVSKKEEKPIAKKIEKEEKTKETPKEEVKPEENKLENKSSFKITKIHVGAVAIIALVLFGVFFVAPKFNEAEETGIPAPEDVIATVNGDSITYGEVDFMRQALVQQTGTQIPFDAAAESVVIATLLRQESEKRNIKVPDSEVEEKLIEIIGEQGFTINQIKQDLELQGMTYEEFLVRYKEQLETEQLVKEISAEANVEVTDIEAATFYEENRELLFADGEATPFVDMSEEIKAFLTAQEEQIAMKTFVDALRANSDIEITYTEGNNIQGEFPINHDESQIHSHNYN